MRTFNFKARNIGQEKYLTYTMGEECELDEDVLDYCEENNLKELLDIIYEEDEDYDYLTYDITKKVSLEEYMMQNMNCEKVLNILRNIANGLISLKEQTVHLSYILLNKSFVYVEDNYDIKFICLPVESKGSVVAEFKGFMRQLLANMKYDVEEDLNYVGKLLTYINSDSFNLRGLVGLAEALMEEAGLSFEGTADIDADGVEVVSAEMPEEEVKATDFMSEASDEDVALPEIGDDEEDEEESVAPVADDEELDSILPAGMKAVAEEQPVEPETAKVEPEVQVESEPEVKPEAEAVKEEPKSQGIPSIQTPVEEPKAAPVKETNEDIIKNKIKMLAGDVPSAKTTDTEVKTINSLEDLDHMLGSKPPVVKKNVVKVNRAALIQSAAAEYEETAELTADMATGTIEDIKDDMNVEKPKSNSILSKSVTDTQAKHTLLNAPKAMPYLIRVNTEERIMLNKVVFKIGKATRGIDYHVSGNGAISRQHAVITQKDGVCYIKDNKSTNHTYVNGNMVEDGVEEILTHDSMIRLGDEEFLFKIR